MRNDFDMIVKKFPVDMEYVNIYPIGDTQIGSPNFNQFLWNKWKRRVMDDPNGYVVLVGDMINNGVKRSKTNVYSETIRPREQKLWLQEELYPLKNRILGAVRGNHEERSVNEVDDCPLYDVMCKLDLEDLYRENMAFIKINVGQKNKDRQYSYMMCLVHGTSENKLKYFGYTIDGLDVMVTGHIHQPMSKFPAKIVIDPHNETVGIKGFTHIIVPSFDEFGGYVAKGMYLPQDGSKIPMVGLSGIDKEVSVLWK